jgi:hypothetical protein
MPSEKSALDVFPHEATTSPFTGPVTVYADFQNLDDENRLRLTCAGTRRDLERQRIELREGLVLTLYTDDANDEGKTDELLAEGVVHYDEAEKCWVAAIDWHALRHASGETGSHTE